MIETEAVEQITNGLRSLVWTVAIVSGLAGACLGTVCSLAILWAVRIRGHDARPDTTAKRSPIDGLHAMGPPTVLVPVRPAPSHADLVRVRSLLVQQLDSPEMQA
jgi:hypothetical protein